MESKAPRKKVNWEKFSLFALLAFGVVFLFLLLFSAFGGNRLITRHVTTSDLINTKDIADLSVCEFVYNGIARTYKENGDPDSLIGKTIQSQEEVRLVPDILESGGEYFFPVFSTAEEMGEYGERFSKVPSHFLRAVELARNNERNVEGIVINAFSEPFVVGKELFEMVEGMDSILEEQGIEEE